MFEATSNGSINIGLKSHHVTNEKNQPNICTRDNYKLWYEQYSPTLTQYNHDIIIVSTIAYHNSSLDEINNRFPVAAYGFCVTDYICV